MLDGRCCICTLNFYKDGTLSSLKCGHTFHYECVKQWIQRSKTCPHCRKKSNINDIVKLFFDQADESFTQEPESSCNQSIVDLKTQLACLSNEVKTLKADLLNKEKSEKELKENLCLEKQKTKHMSALEEHIHYLQAEVNRKEQYKTDCELNLKRLKATEFYAALRRKGKDEKHIDQFLTDRGDVSVHEFLKLTVNEKNNWEKRYRAQDMDIHKLKLENNEFKLTIQELREKLDMLKAENLELTNKLQSKEMQIEIFGKSGGRRSPTFCTISSPFKDRKNNFSPEFLGKRKNEDLMFSFLDDESAKIEAEEVLLNRPTSTKKFNMDEVIVLDESITEVPINRPLGRPITNQSLGNNKRAKKAITIKK